VTALDLDAGGWNVTDLDGVVLAGANGISDVEADLLVVNVKGSDELNVGDVVLAELHVHQARNNLGGVGVLVIFDTLNK
jgi:hypothetical protein